MNLRTSTSACAFAALLRLLVGRDDRRAAAPHESTSLRRASNASASYALKSSALSSNCVFTITDVRFGSRGDDSDGFGCRGERADTCAGASAGAGAGAGAGAAMVGGGMG